MARNDRKAGGTVTFAPNTVKLGDAIKAATESPGTIRPIIETTADPGYVMSAGVTQAQREGEETQRRTTRGDRR